MEGGRADKKERLSPSLKPDVGHLFELRERRWIFRHLNKELKAYQQRLEARGFISGSC